VAWRIDPSLALWMSPVLIGLICSIPLSYFTGSTVCGLALRKWGIFQTVEESRPLPELVELGTALAARPRREPPPALRADYGLLQAVLDPYVNAVHISLLRVKDELPPATEQRLSALRATLIAQGPRALRPRERLALLMDADSMHSLHGEIWATPGDRLAQWWRLALRHYARFAPGPQTVFSHETAAASTPPMPIGATP
jgi:membrane glycosyltransferase